jgi:hypothetical protein
MNSLKNQKNHRYQPGNMKITSDLTNLTTAILILTVQMFFEWTLYFMDVRLPTRYKKRHFKNIWHEKLEKYIY